MKNPSLLVRSE